MVTLGNRSATARWNAPRSAARSTRVSVTSVCGAASSGPGAKTTKKLGSKRAQSTSRRLVTRGRTGTPCTSQTIVSPTVDAELLGHVRLDRDLRAAAVPRPVHHVPATSRSEATSVSR